jgi:triphosphatase
VTRTAWMLRLPDGSEVALALDKGEVKAEQGSEPICEAELELRSGQAESMFDLAAQLHGDIPFQLGNRSKSSRGYDMIGGHKPAASKAEPLLLKPQMTVETAFKAVARSCLGHLEANEACSIAGDDPEGIHQMRVAIRRLRSAFGIFRDVLPRQTASEFAAEFRWLAQTLSPARDWDVFHGDTLGPLQQSLPEETGLIALDALVAAERSKAYGEARATVDSPRYTELKLRFGAWLVASDWSATLPAAEAQLLDGSAADFADGVLRRRHRKLCKKGDDHRELTLPELHELRISAKKLRYATEFFRRFYPRKRVKEYLIAMAALQEVLGGINDAAVGRRRLGELAVGSDADAIHAAAIVSGWFAAQVAERRRRFTDAWRNFTRREGFWGQGPSATA